MGFAARRLAADPVGLVFTARIPVEELTALQDLTVIPDRFRVLPAPRQLATLGI
jgi:hypothetical protein